MSRRYTAQDMRETAADFENYSDMDESVIADMLRQAADDLDRKKEYEYAVEYYDSGKWLVYKDGLTLVDAQKLSSEKWVCRHRIVCREVGEWEEVQDV